MNVCDYGHYYFYTVKLHYAGAAWANEINFLRNYVLGAGSITQPLDLQSSMLPMYHGYVTPLPVKIYNPPVFLVRASTAHTLRL